MLAVHQFFLRLVRAIFKALRRGGSRWPRLLSSFLLMVFYFQFSQFPDIKIYMGRDKFENEDLIRWGHPEDVWFHVDVLSSAHVYARLPACFRTHASVFFAAYFYFALFVGCAGWDALPEPLLNALCQLVKHNSLEGCKKDAVGAYTMLFLVLFFSLEYNVRLLLLPKTLYTLHGVT